jgi:hypothetical protein
MSSMAYSKQQMGGCAVLWPTPCHGSQPSHFNVKATDIIKDIDKVYAWDAAWRGGPRGLRPTTLASLADLRARAEETIARGARYLVLPLKEYDWFCALAMQADIWLRLNPKSPAA